MNKRTIWIVIGVVVVVTTALLIFSGGGQDRRQLTKAATKAAGSSEQALFDGALALEGKGDLLEARKSYGRILADYPDSGLVKEARTRLDKINIKILFSPMGTADSLFYEVKPGDTLTAIAKAHGTTVELLMKSNNLESSLIRPGMKLKVSKAHYSILVDKSQNMLMLKSDDEVFKTYDVSTGENLSTPTGTFKIINKLIDPTWYKAGAVVPPDSPENVLGTRWLGFDALGYGIHGTTDESSIGMHITEGCVRMRNREVEELYSIIPVGVEVTIID